METQAVLFVHGLTGDKSAFDEVAANLESQGLRCYNFNCRGAGETDVTLTVDSMIADIRDTRDLIKRENPGSKYVSIARGIGAMATLEALKDEKDCFAKIFWAGIFYPKIDIEPEYQRLQDAINNKGYGEIVTLRKTYRVKQSYLDSLKSRQYTSQVKQGEKILLIHPYHDEVYPLKSLNEFISKTPPGVCKLTTLDASHPTTHGDEYVHHTIDFLKGL